MDQKWHFIIFYKKIYPLYFEYILGTMNGLNFQIGSNDVKIDIFFHIWIYIIFKILFKSFFAKDWSWNILILISKWISDYFQNLKIKYDLIYWQIMEYLFIWFKCCQPSKHYVSHIFKNILLTRCEIKVHIQLIWIVIIHTKTYLKYSTIHYFVIIFFSLYDLVC